MRRTIIVGDVHGCADELRDLLGKVRFERHSDDLISVGDLINKGPKSREVLELVRDAGARMVLGNHEMSFLAAMRGRKAKLDWHLNVADQLADSTEDWCRWLEAQPMFLDLDHVLVVHAGLQPGKRVNETSARVLANIRTWDGAGDDLNDPSNPPWYDFYAGEKLVAYGHWAMQGLQVHEKTIGLDSGCCYGKQLSALLLPERTVVQVTAREQYCPINGA